MTLISSIAAELPNGMFVFCFYHFGSWFPEEPVSPIQLSDPHARSSSPSLSLPRLSRFNNSRPVPMSPLTSPMSLFVS